MLNEVRHTVTDGLLGLSKTGGSGTHVKIGAAPVSGMDPVIITAGMSLSKIHDRLGLSPLADRVMDSIENGAARILCIPVKGTTDGGISESDRICGENPGDVTLTGKPCNSFQIIVKITGQGGLNVGLFQYSIDGGYNYSDEITVPLSGVYSIDAAGVVIGFTAAEGCMFNIDDTYRFTTTAPQMTNEDVLAALDKAGAIQEEFEFVHIVGECKKDLWAATAEKQRAMQSENHKNAFIMLEAYEKEKLEDIDDYIFGLEADARKIKNYNVQIVAARALYKGMDNITRNVNLAGVAAGLYARVAVNKSIGETAAIQIDEDKIQKLLPEGLQEYQTSILDAARYLTFRQYDGLYGFYVTNANMMCPEGSDYRYAEDVRVLNKVIRRTRKEALLQLQADIDMEDPDGDLAAKAQFIQTPLDDMVDAKEISGVEVTIPGGQDILKTETLHIVIRYMPRGKIRMIEIDVGVNNPYAGTP